MKIEVRADGKCHISGYVNAVERESRPVITPRGMVNERIESGAFQRAIEEADNIAITVDHDRGRNIGNTKDGTLLLKEDAIGLYANCVTEDRAVRDAARAGKIKGWSFGMTEVEDYVEERADRLPLRHITAMKLDHVTLVIEKTPLYSATSVEVRAEGERTKEERATEDTGEVTVEQVDYSEWEKRVRELKRD